MDGADGEGGRVIKKEAASVSCEERKRLRK